MTSFSPKGSITSRSQIASVRPNASVERAAQSRPETASGRIRFPSRTAADSGTIRATKSSICSGDRQTELRLRVRTDQLTELPAERREPVPVATCEEHVRHEGERMTAQVRAATCRKLREQGAQVFD